MMPCRSKVGDEVAFLVEHASIFVGGLDPLGGFQMTYGEDGIRRAIKGHSRPVKKGELVVVTCIEEETKLNWSKWRLKEN